MQAVLVQEPDRLEYTSYRDPEPGPGEVLVELKAAAVNRRDLLVRTGVYPFPLPLVPGSDGAGVRRDTGEEVVILPALRWGPDEAAPGEGFEILGGPTDGTYAELIAVPRENVFPKPAGFSWEEAAAFPLAALTAYRALFTRANLKGGETVLVLGAGSGVSTFAVQLACWAGARVIVTSSSEEKLARSRELGAEAGVSYADGDWVAAVKEHGPIDVVLDSVGSTWQQSLSCLRAGGRCVVFGGTGGTEVELQVRPVYLQQLSLLGTTMGSPDDFHALLRSIDLGRWRPVIDSVRPLADVEAAHARMKAGEQFGKLVLTCA